MRNQGSANRTSYGYLFILPFILLFLVTQLGPMLYTFFLSLNRWDGLLPKTYVGLSNYRRLFTDALFFKSIFNTLSIWAINIVPRMALALLCAVLLTRLKIKGVATYRAIFYFPNLVTAASIATLFSFLFDWQTGFINKLLMNAAIVSEPIKWLGIPALTRTVAGAAVLWTWFGYAVILFISGIHAIPSDLYEAAIVDGAGGWTQFWHITMPNLKGAFSYVFITALIGGLQNFDIPMLLTDGMGSPERSILTVTMYMYSQAFTAFQVGYGAAIAYGLFALVLVVSVFTFNVINGRNGGRAAKGTV